jgi:putative transposase
MRQQSSTWYRRDEETANAAVPKRFQSNHHNVVYSCKYHVIGYPKYRREVLVDLVEQELKQAIRQICAAARAGILEMEVMPDHVHLLVECDPQFGIHRLVRILEGNTSHRLRSQFPALKRQLPSLGPIAISSPQWAALRWP